MPISCQQYDFVEIACMYRYLLEVKMRSGKLIEGVAIDTSIDINQEECIKLLKNNTEMLVVLDDIKSFRTLVANPYFSEVILS